MKLKHIILIGLSVGIMTIQSAFGQINTPSPTENYTISTNFAGTNILSQLLTNASKIARIQLSYGGGGTQPYSANIQFYDATNMMTNYAFSAFTNRLEYVTNIVTTYVSPLTGTTNIQTNSQWFETNSVTASNLLQAPFKSYPAISNVFASYDVNLLVSKGLLIYSPVTNLSVVVTYRPND